ncbi:MAG: hypothetical protein BGO98_33385 [Myxococcales bacterium 68-20]|nr:MAG: hypothetical protein BGO98_33385 [Myxococcales bacterium 68-20]
MKIWPEWREGRAIVVEVRRPSAAWDAGLRAGWEVLAIDGVPIAEATRTRRPSALSEEDREAAGWALLAVLSGRHGAARALSVRAADGATRSISIPAATATNDDEPLTFRLLDDNRGYIAIRSFAQPDLVERFDRALDALRTTRGLVIDVRNNGGGNTALARPIMGRFIQTRKQYAWMSRRAGRQMAPRWPEFVEPRGPWTYTPPVVVLVNHWSASMAEGFPMGMHGIGRATIVGTPMMGLGAGVIDVVLGWTQIPLQVSAEPVFHVDGTPRWRLRPDVLVDVTQPSADDDPIRAPAYVYWLMATERRNADAAKSLLGRERLDVLVDPVEPCGDCRQRSGPTGSGGDRCPLPSRPTSMPNTRPGLTSLDSSSETAFTTRTERSPSGTFPTRARR